MHKKQKRVCIKCGSSGKRRDGTPCRYCSWKKTPPLLPHQAAALARGEALHRRLAREVKRQPALPSAVEVRERVLRLRQDGWSGSDSDLDDLDMLMDVAESWLSNNVIIVHDELLGFGLYDLTTQVLKMTKKKRRKKS